jgi:hypothetical protein
MILQSELDLLADSFGRADDGFFHGAASALALSWGLTRIEVIDAVVASGSDINDVDTDLLRSELYRRASTWEIGTMNRRVMTQGEGR